MTSLRERERESEWERLCGVALVLTSAYSQKTERKAQCSLTQVCVVERCGTQELSGQCLWVFSENNAKRGYELIL